MRALWEIFEDSNKTRYNSILVLLIDLVLRPLDLLVHRLEYWFT